jgi:hypothetical protein
MACLYQMQELGLPFGEVQVTGKYAEKTGEEIRFGVRGPVFTESPTAEDHPHRFYTLRCCKKCRAEWMLAIQRWFHASFATPPAHDPSIHEEARSRVRPGMIQVDGEVPIRVLGATISVPTKRSEV